MSLEVSSTVHPLRLARTMVADSGRLRQPDFGVAPILPLSPYARRGASDEALHHALTVECLRAQAGGQPRLLLLFLLRALRAAEQNARVGRREHGNWHDVYAIGDSIRSLARVENDEAIKLEIFEGDAHRSRE